MPETIFVVVRSKAGYSREDRDSVDAVAALTTPAAAGAIANVVGGSVVELIIDSVPAGIKQSVNAVYGANSPFAPR